MVVVGATGNVGTSVLKALGSSPAVDRILGVARRRPAIDMPSVSWRPADLVDADLEGLFEGADAVVHLAWLIQPSRDEPTMRAVNVDGSHRVFAAAAAAGVPALIYSSSVGAYSYGPKDRAVDESWPTEGTSSCDYAVHKAEVERILDAHEAAHPDQRVVRLRPGLVFKRDAASEIRRLFLGPLFPNRLLRRELVKLIPDLDRLRFQAVHADDLGEAFACAVERDVRGAFNIAAEPVLDPETLSELFEARRVRMPARVVRGAAAATWRARLQPTPAGWLDMALAVPLMDSARARSELGWRPRRRSTEALIELIDGLGDGAGFPTPPLDPDGGGPFRLRELRTRVGAEAS